MNKLSFNIIPSPESNDHQVRIVIDGEDWMKDEYLGIDPSWFFEQETFLQGELMVGRCTCGVEGCGDLPVNVQSTHDRVSREGHWGTRFEFDRQAYLNLVNFSKTDYSWEDLYRRVERLITPVFADSQTTDGLSFDWASCRMEDKLVVLLYSRKGTAVKNPEHRFIRFRWDGKTVEDAMTNARTFLRTHKRIKK